MKKQFLKLAVLSWFIGTGTSFAQSASDYFVAIADKTSPVIIATDANQICSAIPFIDAVTGKVTKGTSSAADCLGKQTAVLRTCTSDGNASCVVVPVVPGGTELKAVDAVSSNSYLKPENIRRGITLGGVTGKWPSAEVTLPPGTSSLLSTLNGYATIVSVPTKKEYTLFGADGTPYKLTISALDSSFQPTTITSDFSSPNTLYKGFEVAKESNLGPGNIKAAVSIFGVTGNAVPRSSWNKFLNGAFFSVTDRNGSETIAKAKVFFDPATENKWMLLRNNNTNALAKTAPSSAAAQTMCSNAKTTSDGSDMGIWALANKKELFWAQVTGGTGSNGLFAAESLFGADAKNFWISTATSGENKVAHFPDSFQPPDTDDPIPTSAMVVCVQRLTAGNGIDSSGNQSEGAFTLVTGPAAPIEFMPIVNSILLNQKLYAHIYKTADSSMALAFVFGTDSVTNDYSVSPFQTTQVDVIKGVCETVKSYLGDLLLPQRLKGGTWGPLKLAQLSSYKLGFTQSPFLNPNNQSADNMLYVLRRLFIAFDPSANVYKTFKFSGVGEAATEYTSTDTSTSGSIICTGVPNTNT